MNTTARFLSIAAVAAFASFGAQADEADASQFATKFDTNRTRAEVAAEAATVAQTRSIEPAGSRVVTYKSTADRAAVRAQAAEALRTGQIPSGEFSASKFEQAFCRRHRTRCQTEGRSSKRTPAFSFAARTPPCLSPTGPSTM